MDRRLTADDDEFSPSKRTSTFQVPQKDLDIVFNTYQKLVDKNTKQLTQNGADICDRLKIPAERILPKRLDDFEQQYSD